jgi:hypothetical protein
VFSVGSGNFFVETADNFYILPGKEENGFDYKFRGMDKTAPKIFEMKFENRTSTRDEAALHKSPTNAKEKLAQVTFMLQNRYKLDANSQKEINESKLVIFHPKRNDYPYHSYPMDSETAKEMLASFPKKITDDANSTVFLAALLAEPSRYSPGYISTLLLLDKRSDLSNSTASPPHEPSKDLQKKIDAGTYQPSGVYEHLPTTFVGSHPGKERSKPVAKDTDLGFGHENDPNKNVTNRDLSGLKQNPAFLGDLEKTYLSLKGQNDATIIEEFVQMIEHRLNLKKTDRKP